MTAPNPGTAQAVAQGCTCPVVDNQKGEGIPAFGDDGKPVRYWWYDTSCPVHSERWVFLPLPGT